MLLIVGGAPYSKLFLKYDILNIFSMNNISIIIDITSHNLKTKQKMLVKSLSFLVTQTDLHIFTQMWRVIEVVLS